MPEWTAFAALTLLAQGGEGRRAVNEQIDAIRTQLGGQSAAAGTSPWVAAASGL